MTEPRTELPPIEQPWATCIAPTVWAVQLTDDTDWEAVAAWVGGTVESIRDATDEYQSCITIPREGGGQPQVAHDDWWVIRNEAGGRIVASPTFLSGQVVADIRERLAVPQREEIRGVGHPGWPDPLSFNWGPDPRANAAAWLEQHRGQHRGIAVQRRFVTEWETLDPAAPAHPASPGAEVPCAEVHGPGEKHESADGSLTWSDPASPAGASAQGAPRVWAVGSPAPDDSVTKVTAENDVTFTRTSWGRWLAQPPEGNGRDYSWAELNALMTLVEGGK